LGSEVKPASIMGMGAGPVSLGKVSSHPNPSFDSLEKSLEVILAMEIASSVVRRDEMCNRYIS
jgi:hypothetical protein